MGESFQGYSWIQDFEADFPQKSALKYWIKQIIMASLIYFQFTIGQLTVLLEIINDL